MPAIDVIRAPTPRQNGLAVTALTLVALWSFGAGVLRTHGGLFAQPAAAEAPPAPAAVPVAAAPLMQDVDATPPARPHAKPPAVSAETAGAQDAALAEASATIGGAQDTGAISPAPAPESQSSPTVEAQTDTPPEAPPS